MKFRQENAQMSCLCDASLKHGDLICKIILTAEQASHTAAFILKWTDGLALSPHSIDIEPPLPQSLLQTLRFPSIGRHFLDSSSERLGRVVHGYDGVFLNSLLSPIGLVHFPSAKSVRSEGGMGG